MDNTLTLSAADREFFTMIARASFANPFGSEREDLDRRIAGIDVPLDRNELYARAVERAETALRRLAVDGRVDLTRYRSEDREVLRTVCLFDIYHRHREAFDASIQQQIAAGDTPCQIPFAPEIFSLLAQRGFSDDEILRYFAIFYQIRRAFYFIESTLTGLSPSMNTLRRHLWNCIFTADIGRYETLLWDRMEDFSTLLLGETGTGKGAAAAAIGRSGFIPFDERKGCFSESFTRNFIHLNLSQYPEALIESELFGHKKGAFTGAIIDHPGAFSRCTPHGSIFLDEIGDLSIPVQIKLLQILQERIFSPVGSHDRLRFHGRVIAATHKPLEAMRRTGHFRDDFYYRLCSDIIVVPPLRQRLREEPRELTEMVRGILSRMLGSSGPGLVDFVCSTLTCSVAPDYPWPGNVRELEQAVRRILVTENFRGETPPIADNRKQQFLTDIDAGALNARELQAGYCSLLYHRHGTIEEVARRTDLDRRTVKKYLGD
jgi:transcriptional regulator with AAA-type ATPase domain